MALPLSGIKVLDFSEIIAGPVTSMLLADRGADVIKLEPPDGDSFRRALPNFPNAPGMSHDFLSHNHNKRSIVADISKPEGLAVAHRLFRWADVAILNMRLPARRRRSVTYEDAAAINPRLIYVSVTGYGEKGPDTDLPGADVATQPRVGDSAGRRLPGGPMPGPTGLAHFDISTSILGCYAIMLALWERERTGRGQKVETNLLLSALTLQMGNMTRVPGKTSDGRPVLRGNMHLSVYRCSDDRYIVASAGGERWDNFCAALGLSEAATDERFNTAEKRTQNAEDLRKILAAHIATRPAIEWDSRFKAKGLAGVMLKDLMEVYDDPQVVANDMIVEYEQPGIGALRIVGLPFNLSGSAGEQWLRRPVPYKGEHTVEVLKELGYTTQEIQTLRKAGAIG